MLIPCPECGREVSDRARACPGCGFPVLEELAQREAQRVRQEDLASREAVGETDCLRCEARGFVMTKDDEGADQFYWCTGCKHTGRVVLCRSKRGYWAIEHDRVDAFVGGEEIGDEEAAFLGTEAPAGQRYEQAGPRHDEE